MKQLTLFILLSIGSAAHAIGQTTYTSSQSGDWSDPTTWGGFGVPGNSDHIIVSAGDTVTHSVNERIERVLIQANGVIVTDARFRIYGSYTNNGVHMGSNQIRLQSGNDTIAGSGEIAAGQFRVNNKRTIISGANLTVTNGSVRCPNNDTLFNYGTLTLSGVNLSGNATSSFYNGSTGVLTANRNVKNNGALIASETGNEIHYNRTGGGNQNIKVTEDGYYNLYIEGNNTNSDRRLTGPTTVLNEFSVEGCTFTHMDTFSLRVGGDFSFISGVYEAENGSVTFNGSTPQSITGDLQLHDMHVASTGGGVSIDSDTLRITGSLTASLGSLTTNGRLIVVSDASGDGSIGNTSGGSISGNVTVQRYIDAGATDWRLMGSPIQNATFNDWKDDFIMSGFPGSHFPSHWFTSLYGYDETQSGSQDVGYTDVSITDNINPGEGYWVFCGDSLGGTNPFTIDVTGELTMGAVNFGVTFTSASGLSEDGWNLVANPYASAIDWNAASWTKTNLDNAIYIWNTDLNQYASYVSGIGTNGGSNIIAMGQGFYVKANAASPTLIAQETVKYDTTVTFLRDERPEELILRLTLNQDEHQAETVLRLIPETSPAFDTQWDAYHFPPVHENPTALSWSANGLNLSVQTSEVHHTDTFNFQSTALIGNASFNYQVERFQNDYCLILWDRQQHERYLLNESGSITFHNQDSTAQRFSLIIARNTTGSASLCETLLHSEQATNERSPTAFFDGQSIRFTGQLQDIMGEPYRILDINGRTIQKGTVSNPQIVLDAHVPSGSYILQCEAPSPLVLKFVVDR